MRAQPFFWTGRLALAAFVFSVLALSGPGRIDIVDGQTRYEVARSFVDYGDLAIRNPNVWFGVFPGRDGALHTYYRFPQSMAGVPAIWIADLIGGGRESTRHFFFALTSAGAAALVAFAYVGWFRRAGLPEREATLWAAAGVFCTPVWFYGTSTFDDILGTAAVVGAVVVADHARRTARWRDAVWAALLAGLSFNCKQPLGVFSLATAAAADDETRAPGVRTRRAATIAAGLALGIAVYIAYDLYKFPPGTKEAHAGLLAKYIPNWPGHFWMALLVLALSPSAGLVWYAPAVVLSAVGMYSSRGAQRRTASALLLGIGVFTVFVALLSVFKGDPAWGPRYFTPLLAVTWLFAPSGAARLGREAVVILLALGATVQVLALAADPHRLYVERTLPSAFGAVEPVLYFAPQVAHLVQRPREIGEIWRARHESGRQFSPAPDPTSAFPVIDEVISEPDAVRQYKLLNAFRPWWASHWYIPESQRPVPILPTAMVFLAGAIASGYVLTYRWSTAGQGAAIHG